jgi:hypothetical protein
MLHFAPTIARIVLRYAAGALVAYGLINPGLGDQIAVDPDLALVLGGLIGAATEAAYVWVSKRGGQT